MDHFVGLDVSLETINVCIVNAAGDVLLEKKIAAEPASIVHLRRARTRLATRRRTPLRSNGRSLSKLKPRRGQTTEGDTSATAHAGTLIG